MTYVFVGRDFPGFSQLSVCSHKGLVYSHKGKTRDALKGRDLVDGDPLNDVDDAVSFERKDKWPSM